MPDTKVKESTAALILFVTNGMNARCQATLRVTVMEVLYPTIKTGAKLVVGSGAKTGFVMSLIDQAPINIFPTTWLDTRTTHGQTQ